MGYVAAKKNAKTQKRKSKGQPDGGQFAPEEHETAPNDLDETAPTPTRGNTKPDPQQETEIIMKPEQFIDYSQQPLDYKDPELWKTPDQGGIHYPEKGEQISDELIAAFSPTYSSWAELLDDAKDTARRRMSDFARIRKDPSLADEVAQWVAEDYMVPVRHAIDQTSPQNRPPAREEGETEEAYNYRAEGLRRAKIRQAVAKVQGNYMNMKVRGVLKKYSLIDEAGLDPNEYMRKIDGRDTAGIKELEKRIEETETLQNRILTPAERATIWEQIRQEQRESDSSNRQAHQQIAYGIISGRIHSRPYSLDQQYEGDDKTGDSLGDRLTTSDIRTSFGPQWDTPKTTAKKSRQAKQAETDAMLQRERELEELRRVGENPVGNKIRDYSLVMQQHLGAEISRRRENGEGWETIKQDYTVPSVDPGQLPKHIAAKALETITTIEDLQQAVQDVSERKGTDRAQALLWLHTLKPQKVTRRQCDNIASFWTHMQGDDRIFDDGDDRHNYENALRLYKAGVLVASGKVRKDWDKQLVA